MAWNSFRDHARVRRSKVQRSSRAEGIAFGFFAIFRRPAFTNRPMRAFRRRTFSAAYKAMCNPWRSDAERSLVGTIMASGMGGAFRNEQPRAKFPGRGCSSKRQRCWEGLNLPPSCRMCRLPPRITTSQNESFPSSPNVVVADSIAISFDGSFRSIRYRKPGYDFRSNGDTLGRSP